MSTNKASYTFDSLGRLVEVFFANGAQALYSYDEMGNRTTVVEVPSLTPPTPTLPTVSSFPKKQTGDFKNNPMMVMLSTGELIGWGDNNTGVLANGVAAATNAVAQRPTFDPNTTMPPSNATIADWAFTNGNLYIVFSNGWVYSAGDNTYGQLGHGDTTARNQLKRIEYFVTNSISVSNVWAASSYSTTNGGGCAYFQDSNKIMYGVGANAAGNLGNHSAPTTNATTPAACYNVPHSSPYVTNVVISCSFTNFSAYFLMSDGTLLVAGFNSTGQLGTGNTTNVTGTFTNALKASSTNLTNITAISANGGYSGAYAGNALAIDSSKNVWTVGFNTYGTLGQGNTTNLSYFTQVSALSNIITAELGGGYYGIGYAINNSGALYTWGYNGQSNLFLNTSTTPQKTPTAATYTPGSASKLFFPKGNNLTTSMQLILLTTGNALVYAGLSNGQIGIASSVNTGNYSYIPTLRHILDGSENIVDVFVHGTGTTQRWFVLTDAGNLYASGSNVDSICTGGISSDTMPANTAWFKISFLP